MDDALLQSLITVGGMLGVAVMGAISQALITRVVVRAERAKMLEQLRKEWAFRDTANRREHIMETVSNLLANTDPDANPSLNYREIVSSIHRLQLLLDRDDGGPERRLNGALNELGEAVQNYLVRDILPEASENPLSDHLDRVQAIISAQGRVIDCTRAVVRGGLPLA